MNKRFRILKEDWKRIDWKATGRAHWSWIKAPLIYGGVGSMLLVDALLVVMLKAGMFDGMGFVSGERAARELVYTNIEFALVGFVFAVLVRAIDRGMPDLVFHGDKPSEIR